MKNLILVRQRQEIQRAEIVMRNEEPEERNTGAPIEGNDQIDQDMVEVDNAELALEAQIDEELTEKDKELE